MLQARPYQRAALNRSDERWQAGIHRQLVVHPTGVGKTVFFSLLPAFYALQPGERMLVLVNRDTLAQQAERKLKAWNPDLTVGIEMGLLQAGGDEQVIVASIQTLGRDGSKRIVKFKPSEFRIFVIDEAHHVGPTYNRVYEHFGILNDKTKLLIGVTATPNRADKKGLAKYGHFQEIVHEMTLLEAVRDGWLVDIKGKRVATTTSLGIIKKTAGDFNEKELALKVNTDIRNAEIVKGWLEYGQHRKTVAFAVNVLHGQMLAQAFQAGGISAEAIWGNDDERKERLERFRRNEFKVIVNCQLLTEGFDDWEVGCIVMARPTMSETLYRQMIGRGTRIQEGINGLLEARKLGQTILKEDVLVLDFVDNTAKHSLVTLSTLFGAGQQTDLNGRSIMELVQTVERLKNHLPDVDLTTAEDIDGIEVRAQELDMFRTTFCPEIIQISDLQWHKTGYDAYCILLGRKDEHCVVRSNMQDKWRVRGVCNGQKIERDFPSLDAAIKWADRQIHLIGGVERTTVIKREAKWHVNKASEDQIKLARRMGIYVPKNATAGEVSLAINKKLTNDINKLVEKTGNIGQLRS